MYAVQHPAVVRRRINIYEEAIRQGHTVKKAWAKAYRAIPKACPVVHLPSTSTTMGIHIDTFIPMPGTFRP